jgi:hypothetical protein
MRHTMAARPGPTPMYLHCTPPISSSMRAMYTLAASGSCSYSVTCEMQKLRIVRDY